MKREIKFRAWDKTSKTIIKDYAHIGMFGELVVTSFHDSAYSDSGCPNLILMQSIGIKDKSGVEIYEGDLCRDSTGVSRVVWDDCFSSFCLRRDSWLSCHFFNEAADPKDIEVIGNILENSELENISKKEDEMDNDKVSEAFEIIKQAMIKDNPSERGSLAHSWHCNIAMMCSDAIGTDKAASRLTFEDAHRIGNDAASRFMKLCFDVETNA